MIDSIPESFDRLPRGYHVNAMVAKLTQHGDSLTLTVEIDRATARRLQLIADSSPSVAVVGNHLLVSSATTDERRQKIAGVLNELDNEWGSVFRRLAE